MFKRSSWSPLLALVAVVALVLGSFGTATAAGLSAKQVKKIAAKVVKKQAPRLSVSHAKTADSASTASTASTASSAATAGNATNLNGQPASAYQDRAAFTGSTGLASVPLAASTPTELRAPVTLTLGPGDHFVAVSGGAAYYGAASSAATWYSIDGACAASASFGYDRRTQGSVLTTGENSSFHVLQPLVAGSTHSFRLCGYSVGASTAYSAQLLVETIALNGTGGTARPADSGGSGTTTPTP